MMPDPVAPSRSLWLKGGWAIVAVLAGLAASFALWDPLEIDEQAHIRRITAHTATSTRADLEADVRARMLAQVRLAEHWGWEEAGTLPSDQEWTLNCRLFMDHYPTEVTLRWLDLDGGVSWTFGRDGWFQNRQANGAADPPGVLQAAVGRESDQPVISPAFRLPDGRTAVQVTVPVVRNGSPIGYLVSDFDSQATLAGMLTDHNPLGYSMAVYQGSLEIFRTPGAGLPDDFWTQDADLPLPGVTWRIAVWPTAALLAEMRSSLPELAGALGGLLGSALLLTLHYKRAAQSKSAELSQARDDLDVRVKQRTAELQEANEHLEAQIGERRRAEDSLRHLSGRLLRLQDEERRRIARELHDGTTQLLGALALNLEQAERRAAKYEDPHLTGLLRGSADFLGRVTTDIRSVSHLLHPPVLDELGLEYVLPWYVNGFSERSSIPVDLDIQPDLGRMPPPVELAFFRLAQEALTNVHRHSGSPTASITVRRDADAATLEIEDEGCGVPESVLEPAKDEIVNVGIGIAGMRERVSQLGGRLEIVTSPQGTIIRAVLPLSQPELPA